MSVSQASRRTGASSRVKADDEEGEEVEILLNRFRLDNLKLRIGATDKEEAYNDGTQAHATGSKDDPDARVKREKLQFGAAFVREMLLFVLFLACFVVAISEKIVGPQYYLAEQARQAFVTPPLYPERIPLHETVTGFEQITTYGDIVHWMRHVLLPNVFETNSYNGQKKTPHGQMFMDGNRVIGAVRLRQVRSQTRCRENSIGADLGIPEQCIGESLDVFDRELRDSFGDEWYFNHTDGNVTKLTDAAAWRHFEAGRAGQLFQQPTRYLYRTMEDLCDEQPDPEKSLLLDLMSRKRPERNSGVDFYCTLQSSVKTGALEGISNAQYPKGGFVVDLPPREYYTAFAENLRARTRLLHAWNKDNAPRPPAPAPAAGNGTLADGNDTATYTESDEVDGPVLPEPPTRFEYSLRAVDELIQNQWLTNKTALVLVELSLYNANVNMIVCARFLFEALPSGRVLAYSQIRPWTLPTGDTASEKFTLVAELFLLVFITYYVMETFYTIRGHMATNWRHCQVCCLQKMRRKDFVPTIPCRNCQTPFDPFELPCCPTCYYDIQARHECWRGYFTNVWNLLDFANVAIFVIVLGLKFKLRSDVGRMSFRDETRYIQLFPVAAVLSLSQSLNSVNIVLMFVKTMKYIGRIKALSILVRTLGTAVVPTCWFLVLFWMLYAGYMFAFHISFAADSFGYKDPSSTLMSLFRMSLGIFEYESLRMTDIYLAPVMFVLYNIVVVVILCNIFISIIDESYGQARWEIQQGRTDYLNSALKLIIGQLQYKWQVFTGTQSSLLDKFSTLVRNIAGVEHLSEEERSMLRIMAKDTLEAMDIELMYEVLMVFNFNPKRVMRLEDHRIFCMTLEHVREQNRARGTNNQDPLADSDAASPGKEAGDILAASPGMLAPDMHLEFFKDDTSKQKRRHKEHRQMQRRLQRLGWTVENVLRRLALVMQVQGLEVPGKDPHLSPRRQSERGSNRFGRLSDIASYHSENVDEDDLPSPPMGDLPSPPMAPLAAVNSHTAHSDAESSTAGSGSTQHTNRRARAQVGVFSMAQGAPIEFTPGRTPPTTPPLETLTEQDE
eukprot:TRINITY_DN4962_c0_g1_i1.p1 TRINITY_DN4962_c0_g1~~TRINITY_DN4962_c0_g1_i1.p1  ORF type:complete len:1069 (+),score=408.04 TRINITY_DN4962_c0_g1_i1:114-3320(+)